MTKKLKPVSPGEILLEEFLEPLGMSMNQLAKEISVPANRISAIVNGSRSITADTALRLARFFGTTPKFWLNLQTLYDIEVAELEVGSEIFAQVKPMEKNTHASQ